MPDFAALRDRMVERQIAARGLRDPRLLAAFRKVPRELFLPDRLKHAAYDDCALPIECGQTISQPYIVARTIDAARIGPADRVLEVGAGSGYAAALIGCIAREVVAIERIPDLADLARSRMQQVGYGNVRIVEGDGSLGLPDAAPFDVIVCAAAGPRVPRSWLDQLAPGGRIVLPIGSINGIQHLTRYTLTEDGRLIEDRLDPVRFVPLIGAQAYDDDD
ncbi:protein-L-isoaspartate(D-aspartate) O-methyltransferase [Sphingomonas sp. GCM10030256]|uniref:protein-L-isoaspartate(D-aspartate) O-methyltransferase n=1 Tax=Sphingomonas sp. GCM10030256 TaxID=3273427 RepID=UPI0036117288